MRSPKPRRGWWHGYYTPVIILFDESRSALQEKASGSSPHQAEGFRSAHRDVECDRRALGSLPGNWYCNIREPLISTRNLADLVPLNSVCGQVQPSAPCPFYPRCAIAHAGRIRLLPRSD